MAPPDDKERDRDELERAFADVKPLHSRSPARVRRTPEPPSAQARIPGTHASIEPLRVHREANGIITGWRVATHRSILDSLEDPRLEIEAECDLHGLRSREADTEVLRFVRSCQRSGKRWVRVIVGKGLHSPRGKGTLKSHIVASLSQRAPARFVLAFRTAPRNLGGTGALILRLVDRV